MIENVLSGSEVRFMTNLFELNESVTQGDLVLLIDGVVPAIVIGAAHVEHRAPEQPFIETSIRGTQISFVENLDINIGLLRKGLITETLHIKKFKIGYRSRKSVAVAYIGDVANPVAVETVIQRLQSIHIDLVSQGAAIEQRLSEHPWSLFPTTRVTQRIDSTLRELNQGKIAILVDGDPTILLVPVSIQDFFQTEEDYSHTFWEATFIRWLRIISFLLSLYLPSLYIAFVDYNPELLPKVLGLQVAWSREGVPFPAATEVFIMQIVVEILREATLRMPKQMGQTIGIVGGLVVGEATVQAGIVSNILIVVVALTAISVFVSPSYEFAIVLRLGSWLMFLAATLLGLYGITLASVYLVYEMAALKSFGIAYLDPFSGEHFRDLFVDGVFRLPVTIMNRRTDHMHTQDRTGESDYRNPVPHPQLQKGIVQRRREKRRHDRP
jgi:hypothetical protein